MTFEDIITRLCDTLKQDSVYVQDTLDNNSYEKIIENKLFDVIMVSTTSFDFMQGLLAGTVENHDDKPVLTDLVFNGATHIL